MWTCNDPPKIHADSGLESGLKWWPTHNSNLAVNYVHGSIKESVLKFRLGWSVFVQQQIEHGRGILSAPFDAMSRERIFQGLSDIDPKNSFP